MTIIYLHAQIRNALTRKNCRFFKETNSVNFCFYKIVFVIRQRLKEYRYGLGIYFFIKELM